MMIRFGFRLLSPRLRPHLRLCFRRALQTQRSSGDPAPWVVCRRHSVLWQGINSGTRWYQTCESVNSGTRWYQTCESVNSGTRWYQTSSVASGNESQFARFQELLSEGQFGQIVELWEGQRDSLGTDPTLYPLVVMALERAGQAELVQTFLEDGSDSALEEGRRSSVQGVPMRSVAVALECAKELGDYSTAVKIYNLFWKTSCNFKPEEVSFPEAFTEDSEWLVRAINAAIFLQAVCMRDLLASRTVRATSEMKPFLRHRFFEQLRYARLTPNADTYEGLLLLSCFKSEAVPWATLTNRRINSSTRTLDTKSYTSWTHHCGTLNPLQALKGILHTVWQHVQYVGSVVLPLERYSELLNVRYQREMSGVYHREAVSCIIKIASMMKTQDVMYTTEACNLVLRALSRLGAVGAMYTTLQRHSHITPNLETYHILVDGCLVDGGKRSTKGAVYRTWRMLVMDAPGIKPDIDLINKLIRCCEVCQDFDRAFFLLSVLNDFSLQPNLETFSRLLRICRAAKDRERFNVVTSLAQRCLPEEATSVNSLVASIEQDWNTEEDVSLANKFISQMEPTISG